MKQYIYNMRAEARAPAGGMLTEVWFFTYKWDVDGEAFVPFEPGALNERPQPGDLLWFRMDQRILGYVPVQEVRGDDLSCYTEVCYDTREIRRAEKAGLYFYDDQVTVYGPVTEEKGLHILGNLRAAIDEHSSTMNLPTG